jgi:multiple sugar transport system ATP-binding protein
VEEPDQDLEDGLELMAKHQVRRLPLVQDGQHVGILSNYHRPMAAVTYEGVSKCFEPNTPVVDDLNLHVADTEFMVLVGPSGCGKTTALRMLAGLEEVTEGTIKIGERVINDVPIKQRDVAMVFQSYGLYPHLTVYSNMAFGLKMRRTPKSEIDVKVKSAARMLGLEGLLHRKPGQLSGGQRQRVAVGRAIVRNPQVFLFDEPLSNLDAQLRLETRINLQKLHQDLGATFIYVTHDQVEAMTMGDRIAVMKEGVLQQVAFPSELYERPVNMYVAGFIGSPKMSFVPVRVEGDVARASGFEVTLPQAPGLAEAVLGIRPENVGEHERVGGPLVELNVEVLEVLGSDQFLYGRCRDDELIARVDPHLAVSVGDTVPLGIRTTRLHLFDPETEKALS